MNVEFYQPFSYLAMLQEVYLTEGDSIPEVANFRKPKTPITIIDL